MDYLTGGVAIAVLIMELRSGSISGTKDENIAQNVSEMVEDIWEVIEKRVAIFFVEEQKQRRELIDELALMRDDNLKLRGTLNDLKLYFFSGQICQVQLSRRRVYCCQRQRCCQQQQYQPFC